MIEGYVTIIDDTWPVCAAANSACLVSRQGTETGRLLAYHDIVAGRLDFGHLNPAVAIAAGGYEHRNGRGRAIVMSTAAFNRGVYVADAEIAFDIPAIAEISPKSTRA